MAKVQMQAQSSVDLRMKSWLADSPDWVGVNFPGPGAPLNGDVQLAATPFSTSPTTGTALNNASGQLTNASGSGLVIG
jgi:hypothetical protein